MWMNKKIFSGIRMVRPLKKAAVCFAAAGFLGGLAFCAPAWAQDDPVSMDVSYVWRNRLYSSDLLGILLQALVFLSYHMVK